MCHTASRESAVTTSAGFNLLGNPWIDPIFGDDDTIWD